MIHEDGEEGLSAARILYYLLREKKVVVVYGRFVVGAVLRVVCFGRTTDPFEEKYQPIDRTNVAVSSSVNESQRGSCTLDSAISTGPQTRKVLQTEHS